jgi:hypothetical protein
MAPAGTRALCAVPNGGRPRAKVLTGGLSSSRGELWVFDPQSLVNEPPG